MKTLKQTLLTAVAYGKGLPARKLWNGLLAFAAIAGIVALAVLTDPPKTAAGPGATNVIVTNTPLPVSGTVSIGNTPIVSIGNTPSVTLSNMPTVGIDSLNNTVKIARDEENPARQPFEVPVNFTIPATQNFGESAGVTVPAGKELVIEYVSANALLPTGQKLIVMNINAACGGSYRFLPTFTGTTSGTTDNFVVAQLTRVYSCANASSFHVTAFRNDTTGTASIFSNISGYLVDVP